MSTVTMSASSVAQVVGINRSQVLEILKEIFIKFHDTVKLNTDVMLDFKIGYLCITDQKELIFRQKDNELMSINDRQSLKKVLKEIDDSYVKIKLNQDIHFDVNKVKSDVLSTASGSSIYMSVATPKTKTRSVISSRIRVNGARRRGQQLSLFKRGTSEYTSEMNKTANEGFMGYTKPSKTSHKSLRRGSGGLSNPHSQKSYKAQPKKLFKNDSMSGKIENSDAVDAYGTFDQANEIRQQQNRSLEVSQLVP